MALTGNFTKIWFTPSEDFFIDVEMTYPEDMPEDDPNYDKRGTTEIIQVPQNDKHTQDYENVYLVLDWCFHYKFNIDSEGNTLLDFGYRIYESKEARDNDTESYIMAGDFVGNHINVTNGDVRILAYEILKTKYGFEQLTDA